MDDVTDVEVVGDSASVEDNKPSCLVDVDCGAH